MAPSVPVEQKKGARVQIFSQGGVAKKFFRSVGLNSYSSARDN